MTKITHLLFYRNGHLAARTLLTTLSIFILFCLGSSPATSGEPADKFSWIFKQRQRSLGQHTIYWSPNAVKIVCETQGYALVCKAPLWKLYGWRTDDKVYRAETLADFFKEFPYDPNSAESANRHFSKQHTYQVDGLTISDIFAGNRRESFKLALVVEPQVAPQVSDLILAYYRIFPAKGVLYLEHHEVPSSSDSKLSNWNNVVGGPWSGDVVVTSSVKKIPYDPHDFEMPRGYRVAKEWRPIFLSVAQRKRAADLANELDLGGVYKKH